MINNINQELLERINYFEKNNEKFYAERLKERVYKDMDDLKNTGFCRGIENYSAHLEFRKKGEKPFTIFNYFPKN